MNFLIVRQLAVGGLFFLFSASAYSQTSFTVKGSVQDTAGNTLPGAIVRLINGQDSVSATADYNGNFGFNNVKFNRFVLKAAYIGYRTAFKNISNDKNEKLLQLAPIRLRENSSVLKEVTITTTPPIKIKEDTVQFDAKAYPVREGDAVEEVIKKLPGLTVDKDGNVTSQGKPITKVRLNGKDFFGADVATAIQNLPAEIVQNIQVVDDYGDQAKITGIKSGDPDKILNINIEPDKKKGYFVRGTGGKGSSGRYIANVRGNSFKGDRSIAFDGALNNTNIRGSGGNGLTESRNGSFNYKNEWGDKISADGGFRVNHSNNETESIRNSQSPAGILPRITNSSSNTNAISQNEDFWGNLELKPDSINYIKLSPYFNLGNNRNLSRGASNVYTDLARSETGYRNQTEGRSGNFGSNVFYNHKFRKRGRNFSIWANVNYTNGNDDRDTKNDVFELNADSTGGTRKQYLYLENINRNFRTSSNLTWSEPLSKKHFLDFSYNFSYSNTEARRDYNNVDTLSGERVFNPQQSNNYQYSFITHKAGVNFRSVHQKYNYSLGLNAQPALLKGNDITGNQSTSKPTFVWMPSARMVYRFTKQKSLTAQYYGRSNQPGFNQLQPLKDSTNIQNVVVGNPDLDPEFNHGLNVDFNQSDWKAGNMFFASLNVNQTFNKIVSTRTQIPNTTRQYTTYMNADGFYTVKGNYSYGMPFAGRKLTVTAYGSGNFNNNVSYNNAVKNIAKNYVAEQGLKLRVDIKDIMDTEFNTSYSFNTTEYSLDSIATRKTNRYYFSIEGRNYFFKDLALGYTINKTINKGFTSGNPNPSIINLFTEYRFLKANAAAIRIYAFDLLNQNTGISRDVFDNEIVDSRSNRLGRYFLMSFILRLKKFG